MDSKLTLEGIEYELVPTVEQVASTESGHPPIIIIEGKLFLAKAIVDKRWPVDDSQKSEEKKDWEVLSFFYDGNKFHSMEDGSFRDEANPLPKLRSDNYTDLNSVPKSAQVVSVRRLTDGQIFSIGDRLWSNAPGVTIEITGFYIPQDEKGQVVLYTKDYGMWPLRSVKKAVEKEWEVLSFTDDGFKYNSVGGGKFKMADSIIPSMSMPFYNVPNTAQILSVKRLTDGEVFSIGDYVNMINAHKITRIIIGGAPQNHERNKILVWLSTSDEPHHHGVDLMAASKYKPKPIFKTHDGVEYFEGQEFEYVFAVLAKGTWETKELNIRMALPTYNSSWLYFSTTDQRDEYIFSNKPYLSQAEVLEFFRKQDIITRDQKSGLTLNLRHFLKLKRNGIQ